MSLPDFISRPADLEHSVYQILASIAMEEIGMSHIINAEGEKLQYVLKTLEGSPGPAISATTQQIHEINESIQTVLSNISINQLHMYNKLNTALNAYRKKKQYSVRTGNIDVELNGIVSNARMIDNLIAILPDSSVELNATGTMADGTPSQVIFSLINAPSGIELHNIENDGATLLIPDNHELVGEEFQLGAVLEDDPATSQTLLVKVDEWGKIDLMIEDENNNFIPVDDPISFTEGDPITFKYLVHWPNDEIGKIEWFSNDALNMEGATNGSEGTIVITAIDDTPTSFKLTANIEDWDFYNTWNGIKQ